MAVGPILLIWVFSRSDWSYLKTNPTEVYRSQSVGEDTGRRVLTIFENRGGAGVDFSKEEPEWNRSQFFTKRLVCSFFIINIADCFLQSMS